MKIPRKALSSVSAVLIGLCFSLPSMAMDKAVFKSMMDKLDAGKYKAVEQYLIREEKRLITDPEYHVISLNHAIRKRSHILAGGQNTKGDDIALGQNENKKAVEMVRQGGDELVLNAIKKTRKSLPGFKNRLDIHLGIVALSAAIGNWNFVGEQLVEILTVSKTIRNRWAWGPVGSMQGDPKTFMLQKVQARIEQLFQVKSRVADRMLIKASKAMIRHYPDVIYGYTNLGVISMVTGKLDQAEKYLNQALEIDPDDHLVKKNLQILKQRKQTRKGE